MGIEYADSHCHLEMLDGGPESYIKGAKNAGVSRILTICTSLSGFDAISKISETFESVYCTAGLHPLYTGEFEDFSSETLEKYAKSSSKVRAVGECGLDRSRAFPDSVYKRQEEIFQAHIEIAGKLSLPLIVHSRDASEKTLEMLSDGIRDHGVRGVWHCFTGDKRLAQRVLDLGFYVGFTGIITYGKKVEDIALAASSIPMDKILIETDAPYLAPVPHRGKKNEPAYVVQVAKKISEIKGIAVEEVAKCTTANFKALFSIE